jgi:hypothetical protein
MNEIGRILMGVGLLLLVLGGARQNRNSFRQIAWGYFLSQQKCFVLFPTGQLDSYQHHSVGSLLPYLALSAIN